VGSNEYDVRTIRVLAARWTAVPSAKEIATADPAAGLDDVALVDGIARMQRNAGAVTLHRDVAGDLAIGPLQMKVSGKAMKRAAAQ
jgi:hypothetical protein